MAHVVPLTSSFLSAVLVEETAFALFQSQAETEVHELRKHKRRNFPGDDGIMYGDSTSLDDYGETEF